MRPIDDIEMDFLQGGMTAPLLLELAEHVHDNAKAKGFWDQVDLKLFDCLLASEVTELLEAMRKPEPQKSKKIPAFWEAEEELADVMLRDIDRMWRDGNKEFHVILNTCENKSPMIFWNSWGSAIGAIGGALAGMMRHAADGNHYWVAQLACRFAEWQHLRLWPAVFAKHRYNLTRPRLHGKRF